MEAITIRRVSVWLDSLAPDQGAFPHALDWAGRLGLPLRAVATRTQPRRVTRSGGDAAIDCGADTLDLSSTIRSCAAACNSGNISLETTSWCGPLDLGVRQFLKPADLCVFGGALPPRGLDALLRGYVHQPWTAALVCPRKWQPVTRVLVLNQHRDPGDGYLDAVIRVCQAFEVTPVVLTVAPSRREAEVRQDFAERAFHAHRLGADFDLMVGYDAPTAAAAAARWRRCSHVFLQRLGTHTWWPWRRVDDLRSLLDRSDTLGLLCVPENKCPSFAPAREDLPAAAPTAAAPAADSHSDGGMIPNVAH
jgi:hypothetical protein